ncbi:hypothetical protein CCB80_03205 [Armatimonadetes bacterium Uphvl-Ar1]|nr:hypothetical protein CCB80_03205 [Armatimonadetes bacterium Uphvl-Ar1]
MDKLTPKQERFCQEYVVDQIASQAAIRSGYSKKTAESQGSTLLRNPKVQARIGELQAEIRERSRLTIDDLIQELERVADANMLSYVRISSDGSAYVDLTNLTKAQAAAISEIQTEEVWEKGPDGDPTKVRKIKFKLHNKLDAIDKLLKRHGGYAPEKQEHTHRHHFGDMTGIDSKTLEDVAFGAKP